MRGFGFWPMPGRAGAVIAAVLILVAIFALIAIGIQILICYLLYSCYKRVPERHRKLSPGLVWLLLIPLFSAVWNFFVYPSLSDSFKSYFNSAGRTDVGDCGRGIGMTLCICLAIATGLSVLARVPVLGVVVPILSCPLGLLSLVLLIVYLVKAIGLKNQIPPQAT